MLEQSARICNACRRLRRSCWVPRTKITVGDRDVVGGATIWRESNALTPPEVRSGPPARPVDLPRPASAIARVEVTATRHFEDAWPTSGGPPVNPRSGAVSERTEQWPADFMASLAEALRALSEQVAPRGVLCPLAR